ncbi:MAG: DUF411 domain-containing protein [Candidatus Pacearchaeota archaeon]|nr:DUF411 domain-containing protein [Candidatus Pacearchaeota archaeon]
MKMKFIFLAVIILIVAAFFIFSGNASSFEVINNFEGKIEMYKSSSCGCCGVYANYLQRNGNSNADIISLESVSGIKKAYNVPSALESCHTTIIGDYFVEGHIPLEAVEKLLTEKPDIAGIAMPGMPEGSPGMLGKKIGDFVIYAVNYDGSYGEFMRI